MKLKIPNWFNNIDKWLQKLEPYARIVVWPIVLLLAFLTVVSIWSEVTKFARFMLSIYLFLFFITTYVIFTIEKRHALRKRAKSSDEDMRESTYIEHSGYNKWISIGLLVLLAIILVPILARQLLPDSLTYQAFLTAFAATGAWVTGIALAVFAYQHYKLRQTEHRFLFEPQIILISAGDAIAKAMTYKNKKYPYCIEWTVLIHNTSRIPVLIKFMEVEVKCWEEDYGNKLYLSPAYCYVLEPADLQPPFRFILTEPHPIRWIIEGPDVGHELDFVSGDSGKRRFELIFRIHATIPQGPSAPIIKELVSNPFTVPQNAKWGTSTPVTSGRAIAW